MALILIPGTLNSIAGREWKAFAGWETSLPGSVSLMYAVSVEEYSFSLPKV
jgi:hypothetical protein